MKKDELRVRIWVGRSVLLAMLFMLSAGSLQAEVCKGEKDCKVCADCSACVYCNAGGGICGKKLARPTGTEELKSAEDLVPAIERRSEVKAGTQIVVATIAGERGKVRFTAGRRADLKLPLEEKLGREFLDSLRSYSVDPDRTGQVEALFAKFVEWERVAKEDRVEPFEKQLGFVYPTSEGQVDRFIFRWNGSQATLGATMAPPLFDGDQVRGLLELYRANWAAMEREIAERDAKVAALKAKKEKEGTLFK